MRLVIQRVSRASVEIDGRKTAVIGAGMVILLGIEDIDREEDIDWLCGKVSRLRIFPDDEGVMNLSVTEIDGDILVVSQFTLHASVKKGNRPSYIRAARPETAIPLYKKFLATLGSTTGKLIRSGEFGAMMNIEMVNNGPVTIFVDSKNRE